MIEGLGELMSSVRAAGRREHVGTQGQPSARQAALLAAWWHLCPGDDAAWVWLLEQLAAGTEPDAPQLHAALDGAAAYPPPSAHSNKHTRGGEWEPYMHRSASPQPTRHSAAAPFIVYSCVYHTVGMPACQ